MFLIRWVLPGFALLLLASCSGKNGLQPVLTGPVHTIELASLEVDSILMIRQLNPVFMIMGSSGMLLDNIVVAQNSASYEREAGQVHDACTQLFRQTLKQEVASMGYTLHASGRKYWDYFKPSQQALRHRTDGILRIRFKQVGFVSSGLESDYIPSAYVSAELIQPDTREVLYRDRFAIGMDDSVVKMASVLEGKINQLTLSGPGVSYASVKELLAHPQESRDALARLTVAAARHVAMGLRGKRGVPQLLAYEPAVIDQAPAMPSFNVMREKMRR